MKKNGFTLIEIIAVIGILAMLLLIIVPSINNILSRSREKLNNEQKAEIISAARAWSAEHLELTEKGNELVPSPNSVSIGTLQDLGYLEDGKVKDLEKNTDLNSDTYICITYAKNQYIYDIGGEECQKTDLP